MSLTVRGLCTASRALTVGSFYPRAIRNVKTNYPASFQRPFSCSVACSEPLENTQTQHHSSLPEDTNPAMWQRVIQLIAGTLATGTMVYFVLYADFGECEHCFMPVGCLNSFRSVVLSTSIQKKHASYFRPTAFTTKKCKIVIPFHTDAIVMLLQYNSGTPAPRCTALHTLTNPF